LGLFPIGNLYASDPLPNNPDLMSEEPFITIAGKVIVFLKQHPSKDNLTLEGLLNEKVINADDYEFLKKNGIKYNPPASAAPNENVLSIFEREHASGSSHILYRLVDDADQAITKIGVLSNLNNFVSEWFEYESDKKSLYIHKDKDLYYFTLCYWDNDYWDKQHVMLIDFPENDKETIDKFKSMLQANTIEYKAHTAQGLLNFSVLLPHDLPMIEKLSRHILVDIFLLSEQDTISYTPDGFRFEAANKTDSE
jgi:hypothetical protein